MVPEYSKESPFCKRTDPSKQNYRIDVALQEFHSMEELLLLLPDCSEKRIKSHINWLVNNCSDHCHIEEKEGKVRFVLRNTNGSGYESIEDASHSWRIINKDYAQKVLDKSAFLHRGTGIPIAIRPFFIQGVMAPGEKRPITLLHQGKQYLAQVTLESIEQSRTRLFWNSDFSHLLHKTFPHHYQLYLQDNEPNTNIYLKFHRISGVAEFRVEFVEEAQPSLVECSNESSIGEKPAASTLPEPKVDWSEAECYFAVWGYDQLDQDRQMVKKHLYLSLSELIGRTSKAVEYKIQNVSACDPRPRSEKPISEALNKQGLLEKVFKNYWENRVAARERYAQYKLVLHNRQTEIQAVSPGAGSSTTLTTTLTIVGPDLGPDEYVPANDKDARDRILASITRRQGQPKFRKELLDAYGGKCAITGCDVVDSLEAAHITPYMGDQTNCIQNGILLRADMHTLFDLGRIAIHPTEFRVILHPSLRGGHYGPLHGKIISVPKQKHLWPSKHALEKQKKDSGL